MKEVDICHILLPVYKELENVILALLLDSNAWINLATKAAILCNKKFNIPGTDLHELCMVNR